MIVTYQIFIEENLLIQKFTGNFSFEDYMKYSWSIMNHPLASYVKKILIDFRTLNFPQFPDDENNDLTKIIELRKNIRKTEPVINDFIHAFWVDKPLPTVIAHLFIERFPDMKYWYCSTEENITKALKISPEFGKLDEIIENLENHFK